jgi:NTE family protein
VAQASLTLQGLVAGRMGPWAAHVYGEWSRAQTDLAPLALGGFLRLSGTAANSINAHTVVLGRTVWARRLGRMPTGLGGDVRAGFSLEAGGGFADGEALTLEALRKAGSGFVSVDTRFGPLYLGAGRSFPGHGAIYLYLGPIW